jgi:ribonuclease VapC
LIAVDSSALVSIQLGEPDAEQFSELIGEDGAPHASTFALFESRTVRWFRGGGVRLREFEEWLRVARLVAVAFDEYHALLAFDAYRRWGKGNHPAGLNLGDRVSYALAKRLGVPLLFNGADFAKTDVRPVL